MASEEELRAHYEHHYAELENLFRAAVVTAGGLIRLPAPVVEASREIAMVRRTEHDGTLVFEVVSDPPG